MKIVIGVVDNYIFYFWKDEELWLSRLAWSGSLNIRIKKSNNFALRDLFHKYSACAPLL